uniref:Uncharacterized protein n=1 Tax=Echeneis naucrates TaxID=173247 RepID=A0A665VZV4_ECHNA
MRSASARQHGSSSSPLLPVRLSRVSVEDIDVLVEEKLHKLSRLQELPLAAQDAGSLL